MISDKAALNQDQPGDPSIPAAFRALNLRRLDLDRCIAGLPANDLSREELWQELEAVLVALRNLVSRLASSPATQLPELRAKAEVLAMLLNPDDSEGGLVISETERSVLALSLTDDIIRMPDR